MLRIWLGNGSNRVEVLYRGGVPIRTNRGKLLGLTWALSKTSYYTLGCPKLVVMVDHKPLIGLLKKGEIGAIDNLRLQALAKKTMQWNFEI